MNPDSQTTKRRFTGKGHGVDRYEFGRHDDQGCGLPRLSVVDNPGK